MRVAGRAHEQPSADGKLLKGSIERHRRLAGDVFIVHIGSHADNPPRDFLGIPERCRFNASPLGKSRCAMLWLTMATSSAAAAVRVRELAAGDERDAEHREEARRHESGRWRGGLLRHRLACTLRR